MIVSKKVEGSAVDSAAVSDSVPAAELPGGAVSIGA